MNAWLTQRRRGAKIKLPMHYLLSPIHASASLRLCVRFLVPELVLVCLLGSLCSRAASADWPMLRGQPDHSGYVPGPLTPPYRLVWVREIENERLGTAVEPIVAEGKLFVGTHAGNLYALRADSGEPQWCFKTDGAFLHSPACAEGLVFAGSTDGNLYALNINMGETAWSLFAGVGGFSAAPVITQGTIYIGTRAGDFLAVSLKSGKLVWRQSVGVPIRQTAAVDSGRVYVTGEDLRVRCFGAIDGKPLWTSDQFVGQTARDYYPIIVHKGGLAFVVVRTNPILNMGQRIGQDRTLLCRQAGMDDSSWQKLDSWIKSAAAHGTPDLRDKEQKAITQYLDEHREARTFFVLDAETGQGSSEVPVLWIGGCQGVGAEPAMTSNGDLLVFYRSAYGNWNQGVAPLVALGLLDIAQNRISPLFHHQGMQPTWNCFWGTADESQNFLVVGDTVVIVHQGTLSGFNLQTHELFPIWGERDTYGGFANPPWARNEWHGPGRAAVAVANGRIYWQTGSRILCLEPKQSGGSPQRKLTPDVVRNVVPATIAPKVRLPSPQDLRAMLEATTEEVVWKSWAPLFTDPGLAGRFFSFDNSGDLFEALAWAYPFLSRELQAKTKTLLRSEWEQHPPFSRRAWYSLNIGARREPFWVPPELCARLGADRPADPFGNIYAVWLYANRCNEEATVTNDWPQLKAAYESFCNSNWKLDRARGDVFANRYLASFLAFASIAQSVGDLETSRHARARADETLTALVQWWQHAASEGTLQTFAKSAQLDPFIGKGDAIFLALAPHRHKLALFQDMTPEVAALLRAKAPEAIDKVWRTFQTLCPTWNLMGEERQVHFGENFVDSPDFALSGFKAFVWLKEATTTELTHKIDLPFCRADLSYLTKVALTLEGAWSPRPRLPGVNPLQR